MGSDDEQGEQGEQLEGVKGRGGWGPHPESVMGVQGECVCVCEWKGSWRRGQQSGGRGSGASLRSKGLAERRAWM